MAQKRIPSGVEAMDELLGGGYETDAVTTIYGPAGSGKTNLALLASIKVASSGKKVIYIDTEGGFSVERLKQLTADSKNVLSNILFLKPTRFSEQRKAFEKLRDVVNKRDVGLIVVDTIAMLYRLELGKSEDIYEINRELGAQLASLTEIVRKKSVPVIIINQVYSSFDDTNRVKMVGGDIMKYGSKCLVELQHLPNGRRKAILKKHRSLPEDREVMFEITEKELKTIKEKESKGFRLF